MITNGIKDIQEDYKLLKAALDASSCGVTIVDVRHPDVPIVYVNRAFEDLVGYGQNEIIGRNSQFLVGEDLDQAAIDTIIQSMSEERSCKVLMRMYRKSGELVWIELNLSPIRDKQGVVTYSVGVQTDVTERELIRKELDAQRIELENSLEELHRQSEDKKKLLSLVAHDLRAPLANIQSLNDLAVESKNTSEANKFIQMSSNLAADTRELVSDLLNWRSIERGDFELRKGSVNLPAFAESIEKYLVHFAARKDIHIELQKRFEAKYFVMDIKRIQQVISNLVSNAIKYSQRGSRVEVLMSITDNDFVLKVRDFGKGIPEQELGKLFRAFEKTSAMPTEGESSFGLGLSIVHKIVEMHGGSIEVESEVGAGTCFTVKI